MNAPVNTSSSPSAYVPPSDEQITQLLRSARTIAVVGLSSRPFRASSNVIVPLTKFAKTDGAYDIDTIIPTATPWLSLSQDAEFAGEPVPTNAFITQFVVLPDSTIPSGGLPDSFVGMLYEGETFRRALSVQDFFNSSVPSFYIIGGNDEIDANTPLPASYEGKILLKETDTITNPAVRSYRVTYQVFNEGGTKDITISSTEYLIPGRVAINFITGS